MGIFVGTIILDDPIKWRYKNSDGRCAVVLQSVAFPEPRFHHLKGYRYEKQCLIWMESWRMRITYDANKRAKTLEERDLDFAQADQVFEGDTLTVEDDRRDYGEVRHQTIGRLRRSVVMVVWTPREDARHIISMRRCNDKERERYQATLDRS